MKQCHSIHKPRKQNDKGIDIKQWWLKTLPANAISGRLGGGNDDETFAAAKKSNLFLKTCHS